VAVTGDFRARPLNLGGRRQRDKGIPVLHENVCPVCGISSIPYHEIGMTATGSSTGRIHASPGSGFAFDTE
jgi:hypothetical protein